MTVIFTKDIVAELLKKTKPDTGPYERLTEIIAVMNRGTMLSASDLAYIKSRQVVERPECEHITGQGGCKIGIAAKCPAAKGWARGLIGCTHYAAPEPSTKKNEKPLEPVTR